MSSKKSSVAKGLGKTLAYLQDTIDVAFSWGFHKLKSVKLSEEDSHEGKKKAKKAANKVFHFFGEIGNSFYNEYEKLKSKRFKK